MTFVRVVLIVAALHTAGAPALSAQDGVLPRDLARLAREDGCGPVHGFYNRPGMIEPPYVYGVIPGEREASVAFWCEGRGDREYFLMVGGVEGKRATLRWPAFPGGLSLTEPGDWQLSSFQRVDRPEESGPALTLRSRRALTSSYDGIASLFLEHAGVWYFRVLD